MFGDKSNDGWPISSEVGNTNSTSEFAIPTAKAMGHPTSRITCNGLLRPTLALCCLIGTAGCGELKSEWAYRKLPLSDAPLDELAVTLPVGTMRTTIGFTYVDQARWPEMQTALVLVGGRDDRAVGKLLLTVRTPRLGTTVLRRVVFKAELKGSPDPSATPGPVARLSDVLRRLGQLQGKPAVDRAHRLMAAVLIRILESLPDVAPPQSDYQRYADALALIPPNGKVTLTNATPKTYGVSYQASDTSR